MDSCNTYRRDLRTRSQAQAGRLQILQPEPGLGRQRFADTSLKLLRERRDLLLAQDTARTVTEGGIRGPHDRPAPVAASAGTGEDNRRDTARTHLRAEASCAGQQVQVSEHGCARDHLRDRLPSISDSGGSPRLDASRHWCRLGTAVPGIRLPSFPRPHRCPGRHRYRPGRADPGVTALSVRDSIGLRWRSVMSPLPLQEEVLYWRMTPPPPARSPSTRHRPGQRCRRSARQRCSSSVADGECSSLAEAWSARRLPEQAVVQGRTESQ